MPVTILNTGTFNPGPGASPAAGNAAASGLALSPAVTTGGTTTAPGGLAAASAAGSGISRTGPGRAGDNCGTDQYGTGTQASAWTAWQTVTGRTIQVWRLYYPGLPPSSIDANCQAAKNAGIAVAMSFKPTIATSSGGGSSTDRATISSFLSSCQAYGLTAMCCMYHEPGHEGLSTSNYKWTQEYYGPTIRAYYPLVFSGQCGDFTNGSLATYESYYDAGQFDAANVDYYCASSWTLGGSTLMDGHAAFADAQGLGSFGCWEFGADEDVVSTGTSTAWWNYMASFFAARAAAGKGIGYATHFSLATPDGVAGHPFNNAAATYEIPLYDALWDAVS